MYKNSNAPSHMHSIKPPKCWDLLHIILRELTSNTYRYIRKKQTDCQTSIGLRLPENDLKKVETYWNLSGLYVKVYILILVRLLVLSIKLFIKA
jgi:hypothetical protein